MLLVPLQFQPNIPSHCCYGVFFIFLLSKVCSTYFEAYAVHMVFLTALKHSTSQAFMFGKWILCVYYCVLSRMKALDCFVHSEEVAIIC